MSAQLIALPKLAEWMSVMQARTESALAHALPGEDHMPQRLHTAMRYAALGGGKRVRALLVYAAGEVAGASIAQLDAAVVAVELIHAYSLVHDDMPCMDDDVLRRGKPTVHVAFDEPTALLVGDALQSLAFAVLARAPGLDANARLAMVQLLAHASGSLGMAGGQAIDLESVGAALTLEQLEQMHRLKTGALLRASVLLGGMSGSALDDSAIAAIDHYARTVGLAFQVVDDVLDVETDTATLGKTAGKDADQNKPTYVSILGLAESKVLAARLHQEALAALAPLGEAALRLRELADFIVSRAY